MTQPPQGPYDVGPRDPDPDRPASPPFEDPPPQLPGPGTWPEPLDPARPQPQQRPQDIPEQPQTSGGGGLPFPHRTWTTRNGTRVTVGGCCLPLPIGCLATTLVGAAAGVLAWRRR